MSVNRSAYAGVAAALGLAVAALVLTTATGASARSGWTVTTQVTVRGGTADPTGAPTDRTDRPPRRPDTATRPTHPSAAPGTAADPTPSLEHTESGGAGPAPVGPAPVEPAPATPEPPDPPAGPAQPAEPEPPAGTDP